MIMKSMMNRETIGDISRRVASKYPGKTAVIFRDTVLSFAELEREACRFANLMQSMGIGKGDRVAINAYNSHYYLISFLGLAKIGAVQVPVNYMLNTEEIAYVVSHSGSRIFLVEDELLHLVEKNMELFPTIERWGVIQLKAGTVPKGFFNLAYEMGSMPDGEPDVAVLPEDIVQIPYTSGTESKPKGAMLSHRALMSQYFSCLVEGEYQRSDTSVQALPLFHCAQLHCFLVPFVYIGATSVILHRADPVEIMKNIDTYSATHFFAPPTVWIGILNHPRFREFNLSSLKKGAYGASIMPVEIMNQIHATFPGIRLWNYYGQTEMGPVATILRPEDQIRKPGSAGQPVLNVETRLMDDDGTFVETGSIGEIVHRSGQVMTGYLNDEEKTSEAFSHGWFHSGDLGMFDEDGYLYVVDRKKDMIKTGGENVASREVEEALYRIPGVEEAAVIGLPDPKWIEIVAAVIVPKKGVTLTEQGLIEQCRRELAAFKCPKKIFFLERLPKNPSGKILKRELKKQYTEAVCQ